MLQQLQPWFNKFGFWLLLFTVVKLVGVTNPPLEAGHNWRQVTGLMVARNFVEIDANPMYPRIDDHEGRTGIIGMEFPLLNYFHYGLADIFGYNHWWGRLLNLLVTTAGIWFFYRFTLLFYAKKTALYSGIILLLSIWFGFSRKTMPDTFSVSIMMMALYCAAVFLKDKKSWLFVAFLVLATLGGLAKIPAGIYLVLIPLLAVYFGWKSRASIALVLGAIIPVLAVFWWYFYWNPHLADTYGSWYNAGMTFGAGGRELISHLDLVFKRFYFSAFTSFILFGAFVFGAIQWVRIGERKLTLPVLAVSFVFLVYMVKSGFYFHHHNYYIIPFVPVMALITGYGLSTVNKRMWLVCSVLVVGGIESIANQQHGFFIKDNEQYKMELEAFLDQHISKDALIAINGNGNPQLMYLSHRKGWTIDDNQLRDREYLDELAKQGCEFLVVHGNGTNGPSMEVVGKNNHFYICRLGK